MMLKALALNCSLKASPKVSNTQALIDNVAGLFAVALREPHPH